MGADLLSDQLLVCHNYCQLSLALQAPSCSMLLLNCSDKNQYQKEKTGGLPQAIFFPTLQQLQFAYVQITLEKQLKGSHSDQNLFIYSFFLTKKTSHSRAYQCSFQRSRMGFGFCLLLIQERGTKFSDFFINCVNLSNISTEKTGNAQGPSTYHC